MTPDASVSTWIGQLKAGEREAAQELWQRYFRRLVGLARKRLEGHSRRVADEEDVALSAFDSFCRAAENGRFPQLDDRDDLWQMLVVITVRKAFDLVEHDRAAKRGGGKVLGESALRNLIGSESELRNIERIVGHEPSPEFAAQLTERMEHLFSLLRDRDLERIAQMKLEGWTNAEIAAELACVPRTVERRLRLIREIWAGEITA